jgi:hypothetical protein
MLLLPLPDHDVEPPRSALPDDERAALRERTAFCLVPGVNGSNRATSARMGAFRAG